jgi:hypothetical protein
MMEKITFQATVYKVTTLADGGLSITLWLPEDAIEAAALLMECKRNEIPLVVKAEDIDPFRRQSNQNGD